MTRAELIPSTTIDRICAHRDAAIARMREAIEARVLAGRLATEAAALAKEAHGPHSYYSEARGRDAHRAMFDDVDAEAAMEAYRRHVDASTWSNLLVLTGMSHLMDRTAKEQFDKDLAGDVPEVTPDNVRATFEGLAGDATLIFQRGLARAFSDLDRRFKSHDAFKLGTRVILRWVFNQWGAWNYGSRAADTILDLERVFAVLDGDPTNYGSLVAQVRNDRGHGLDPRQSVTESTYFRVKGYMNGNAHLWFTRDDLVEKANRVLAEYYGEVLPDAVPGAREADADLRSKTGALSRDLAFYPTPTALADKVVGDLHLAYLFSQERFRGVLRVLEPSAGTGRLVAPAAATGVPIHAVEVDKDRVWQLVAAFRSRPNVTVQRANFLDLTPAPVYSHIVMNPPFCGTHWMEHVVHAYDFLRPGGKLVAILPVTADVGDTRKHREFRDWLMRIPSERRFKDLPPESFAESGTMINTVTLTLKRAGWLAE